MAFQSSGTYKYPSSRHRSQPIQEWEKPRLFIETDDDGELVVNKETEQCLEKITKPVVVISVVGLYSTGKSFLLNRLSGLGQGFSLGASTKGIWIWVVPHPQRDDCRLVLIDTEGLGAMDKENLDHDIWIFALGILLSGTFVYNSKGAIDQKAMNDLHLVTAVAERIKVKSRSDDDIGVGEEGRNPATSRSGSKDDELKEFFPSFVWALRDFTLKLVINGKACSPDEYLEHALTAKVPGQRKDIKVSDGKMVNQKQIHPKDCIKDYFAQRRCFVFPFPVKDFDLMDRIDILEDCYFHKDFLKVTNEFCDYIFSQSKVKTIFNDITTGRALARLAAIYVNSIRNGNAPCIQNAVESTAKIENEQAIKESVDLYTKRFEASVTFPTETQQDICDCHAKCSYEAFDFFLTKTVFDYNKLYYQQLVDKVDQTYAQFRNTNEMKSCEKQLLDLYKKIEDTDYSFSGGYSKYKEDMLELVDTYEKTSHLKDVAPYAFDAFTKAREHTRQLILKADAKLNEVEKNQKEYAKKLRSKYTHIANGLIRTGDIVAELYQNEVLTEKERDDIQLLLPTTIRANEQLLNTLMSKDNRAYDCFLTALSNTDQIHISEIMKREDKYLDAEHSLIIKRNYTTLIDNIDVDCGLLLDRLHESGLITVREMADIAAKSTKHEKSEILLALVSRFRPENFSRFVQTLKESCQEHVVCILANKECPKTKSIISTSTAVESRFKSKYSEKQEKLQRNLELHDDSTQNLLHSKKRMKEPPFHVKRKSFMTLGSRFSDLPDELQTELSLKVAVFGQKTVLHSEPSVDICFRKLLQGFIRHKTEFSRKQSEVEDMREILRRVNDSADKHKTEIQILGELQKQSNELQREKGELQTQMKELKNQRDTFQKENDELQKQRNEHKTEKGILKKQSGKIQKEKNELQKQRDELQKENDKLREQSSEAKKLMEKNSKTFEDLLMEKDGAAAELKQKLEQRRKAWAEEKEHLKNEMQEIRKSFSDFKAAQEAKEAAEKAMEEEQKKTKLMEEEKEQSKKEHLERLLAKAEEDQKIQGSDEESGVLEKIQMVVEAVIIAPVKLIFIPIKYFRDLS